MAGALPAVSGCTAVGRDDDAAYERAASAARARIHVIITIDGGQKVLVQHSLPYEEGVDARALLESVADVRPASGADLRWINGHGGGNLTPLGREPARWFARVNGVEQADPLPAVEVEPGDELWWDLHRYTTYPRIPLAVGSFPRVIFDAARQAPLRIAWAPGAEPVARDLERVFERLEPKVEPVQVTSRVLERRVGVEAVREDSVNIVVGRWSELRKDPRVADIGFDPARFGLVNWIEGDTVRVQHPDQQGSTPVEGASGLVLATTLDGTAEAPPVLLVTGFDDEGVRAACTALLEGRLLHRLSGVVDAQGEVLT